MDDLTLREATPEDIPALVQVIHAAFEEYRGILEPPSGAHSETAERIRAQLTSARAIMALGNQAIVGCVIFRPENDYVYLGRLAVLPQYRQRSIGSKLVARVEDQTRSLGLSRVRLGVRVALTANQEFFKRLGYRVVSYGSHAGYDKPTFVNLEKDIAQ